MTDGALRPSPPTGWLNPSTRAEARVPTDVILILDDPLFPGGFRQGRVIGVVDAEQTENGKTNRNDRLVVVPIKDKRAPGVLSDLPQEFVSDMERFFSTYHRAERNEFKIVDIGGIGKTLKLIESTLLPKAR
jgi:inorganic pyrophosphatase